MVKLYSHLECPAPAHIERRQAGRFENLLKKIMKRRTIAKTRTNEARLPGSITIIIPWPPTVFIRLLVSLISVILVKAVFAITLLYPICSAMDKPFSLLIALPKELRLEIWEYLLSPKVDETAWHDSETALSIITRKCPRRFPKRYDRFYGRTPPAFLNSKASAHDWDDNVSCECHGEPFTILNSKEKLCPSILCVNRFIYEEALPCLYRRRMFAADGNKSYSTLYDRLADSWFFLHRFLCEISNEARVHVRSIRIPMLLSHFEVYGCREAFGEYVSSGPKASFNIPVAPFACQNVKVEKLKSQPPGVVFRQA